MHTIQTTAVFLWLLPAAAKIILPLVIMVVVSLGKLVSKRAREKTAPAGLRLNTS
ncbi:MAG: hypothetical protein ACWGOX_16235 [Desulforhopalus sp.]